MSAGFIFLLAIAIVLACLIWWGVRRLNKEASEPPEVKFVVKSHRLWPGPDKLPNLSEPLPAVLHAQPNPGLPARTLPPGYRLVHKVFSEPDGSWQSAFIADIDCAGGTMSIDYLLSGEKVSLEFDESGKIFVATPEQKL